MSSSATPPLNLRRMQPTAELMSPRAPAVLAASLAAATHERLPTRAAVEALRRREGALALAVAAGPSEPALPYRLEGLGTKLAGQGVTIPLAQRTQGMLDAV
jgi:hypothetical protein